jgi:adenosylmethionine-8-amino-7-oxononanoate aminotransferase
VANKDTLERFPATVDPASVVLQNGLNHGLLLYSRRQNAGRYGDWLMIAPPLIVDTDNCDELINGLEAALSDSVDELLSHR